MGFYLNLTGKMFLGSLAALGAAKLVEALTEDDHRSVEEKMTPEWKSAVERARIGGDMQRFAELFRQIAPAATDDDIRGFWATLTPGR
jgi:hypothetical protein